MGTFRICSFALVGASLSGCAGIPSYNLLESAPHKDVLRCVVFVERSFSAGVYQRIALRELERIQADGRRREFPLYEVSFEFRGPGSVKLARVLIYPPKDRETHLELAKDPQPRIETLLFKS